MSTGKRLAKRSILGTKVVVPGQDGRYYPGHILAVKTFEDASAENRYSVRFEDSKRVFEFCEKDILGPGFRTSVADVQLTKGQVVYVTHNNREMQGKVVRHDFDSQDVLLTVGNASNEDETLLMKVDEVRLLESRKSARLVNSDTDFSKLLADISISSSTSAASAFDKRKGKISTLAIDVPRSDYVQIAGSRKRRTSENLPDDETVLSECSAAMLLMKLSCSPHSPFGQLQSPQQSPYADLPSPAGSSSGASSFRSATPSPPLSTSTTDEGIVKDLTLKKIVFRCTFPGCHEQRDHVDAIESHVRVEHLHRPEEVDEDDEDRDFEEEFYYTEIEVPRSAASDDPPSGHMAALSLADHLDMARPAHEDPGRPARSAELHNGSNSLLSKSLPSRPVTIPVTIAPTQNSHGKMILISPPARSPSSSLSSSMKSPVRRMRDGGKKCRKVFGLEQRDMWCTQCKWKKACARFGPHAVVETGSASASSSASPVFTAVSVSGPQLGSSVPRLLGVKALKF